MSKFRKDDKKEVPAISTSSLPDIVFMILFFFMVTVQMRDMTLKVKNNLPNITEVTKLEKKSLICNIFVGEPLPAYQKMHGSESIIQLNDVFATKNDIINFVSAERESRAEAEIPLMVYNLKVDEYTKMGIVQDIKQELRRASALHISYSANKKVTID